MGGLRGDIAPVPGVPRGRPRRRLPRGGAATSMSSSYGGSSHLRLRGRRFHVDRDRLPGRIALAAQRASAGVIDTCGFKKDGFYFYQSQWTESPFCTCSRTGTGRGRRASSSRLRATPTATRWSCSSTENRWGEGLRFCPGMEGRYGNSRRARVPRTTNDLHLDGTSLTNPAR